VTRSHNKKRNVGVVYELLLRRVSECLVNENTEEAQGTLDILSRRFRKGTALYKEFRLFRALAKSQVSDSDIAKAILQEAKSAARSTDVSALEKEKSSLIREMNYNLKDPMLYRRYVPDYKALATIQTLLNDWRDSTGSDIERIALYESRVVDHLLEEKAIANLEEEKNQDIDGLVVKIMTEKINKKYGKDFDRDQRKILKLYAFSTSSGDNAGRQDLEKYLLEVSDKAIKNISLLEKQTKNQILKNKISNVRDQIITESKRDPDDKKIVRFLTLIDLCKEIKESVV
jgi:hypothetical protein